MAYAFIDGEFKYVPDDANEKFNFGLPAGDPFAPAAETYQPGYPSEPAQGFAPEPTPELAQGLSEQPDPFSVSPSLGDAGLLEAPTAEQPIPGPTPPEPLPTSTSSSSGYSVSRRHNPYEPTKVDLSGPLAGYEAAAGQAAAAQGRAEEALEYEQAERTRLGADRDRVAAEDQKARDAKALERNDFLAEEGRKIDFAVKSVPTMEPGRVFNNMSGWAKGLMIIGSALNGWNVRYNQGKNPIADTLMELARNDMEAQKVDIETAREKVFRAERGYERGSKSWDTQMHDFDVGVLQRATAFDRQFADLQLNTQSEISKANIGVQRAELGMRINQLRMDMINREAERYDRFNAQRYEINSQSARQQAGFAHDKEMEAFKRKATGGDLKRAIRSPVDGRIVGFHSIGTDGQVTEYAGKLAGTKESIDHLVEIKALQDKVGGAAITNWTQLLSSADKQKLYREYGEYINSKIKSFSGAAATEGERKSYRTNLPLEKFWGPDNAGTLDAELEDVLTRQNALNATSLDDGAGQTAGYDAREMLDAALARQGSSQPKAPEGLHGTATKFADSAARPDSERVPAGREFVAKAFEAADTAHGRAEISKMQSKLRKLPTAARMLPDVDGDKDIVDVLENIKYLGELRQGGREAGRREKDAYRKAQQEPTSFGYERPLE